MASTINALKYITALGIQQEPEADKLELLYEARRTFLSVVYAQGYTSTAPYSTWMQNNRTFFSASSGFTYTIGNKTYTISGSTIYAINPDEYSLVQKRAATLGITLTLSNFGAWAGVGSTQLFYW